MPTVKVYEFNGDRAGEMELPEAIFDVPLHVSAMHQAVVAHLANCRQGTHKAKTRGEVSGGGKKPWRQKHTGRAFADLDSRRRCSWPEAERLSPESK